MHYYIVIYLWDKSVRRNKPLLLSCVFSKATLCSMAFLKNEKMEGMRVELFYMKEQEEGDEVTQAGGSGQRHPGPPD